MLAYVRKFTYLSAAKKSNKEYLTYGKGKHKIWENHSFRRNFQQGGTKLIVRWLYFCLLRRPVTSATVNQSALLHRTQRIRCSFYSSKDQAKSRGEFRRRWASIQPDILLTGLLFVSLQKQNLFIWKIKALFRCAQCLPNYGRKRLAEESKWWGGVME